MDKIFNLLRECGALQVEFAATLAHDQAPDRELKCEILLHRCLTLESALTFNWLELDDFPSPCPRSDLAYQPTVLPRDLNINPYTFKTLNTAKVYLLFWIAQAVLLRCAYQAEKVISGCSNATRMRQCAGEICRAVAFFMQPRNQMSSGHAVMVAVSQASKCYINCADKDMFVWCQGIYSLLECHGLDIAGAMSRSDSDLWVVVNGQIN